MQDKQVIFQHLKNKGYYVIPNYFNSETCDRLIKLIDHHMNLNEHKVQRDFKEGLGGDHRLFGLEKYDQDIHNLLNNNPYLPLIKEYTNNPTMTASSVLAGKIEPIERRIVNSGAGWHQDPGTHRVKKVKLLVYLNDVNTTNGPFTIIPATKKEDLDKLQLHPNKYDLRQDVANHHKNLRFHDEFIHKLKSKNIIPIELTANAGDLIIVDVGNIHMGKPIEKGVRYSLTTYHQENSITAANYSRSISKYTV